MKSTKMLDIAPFVLTLQIDIIHNTHTYIHTYICIYVLLLPEVFTSLDIVIHMPHTLPISLSFIFSWISIFCYMYVYISYYIYFRFIVIHCFIISIIDYFLKNMFQWVQLIRAYLMCAPDETDPELYQLPVFLD